MSCPPCPCGDPQALPCRSAGGAMGLGERSSFHCLEFWATFPWAAVGAPCLGFLTCPSPLLHGSVPRPRPAWRAPSLSAGGR